MTIVQVQNVEKRFGSFQALNKINLQVNKGEVFGFIGPNGGREIDDYPCVVRDHPS